MSAVMDALEIIAWGFAALLATPFLLLGAAIGMIGMVYTACAVIALVDWIRHR